MMIIVIVYFTMQEGSTAFSLHDVQAFQILGASSGTYVSSAHSCLFWGS